jgi:hypothetical protein
MSSASMALLIRVPGFILAPPSRHASPAVSDGGRGRSSPQNRSEE